MTASKGLGTTGDGIGTVTPLDHKLAQSGLIAKTGGASNAVRSGVFYGGSDSLVSGTSGMSYNVGAFTAALSRGGSAGTVLLANDGTVNVPTTAAPGSNSRIDTVYVWQREFSLDGTDSNPVIGVAQGSAAASPVAPSLAAFPGALELARIIVPAGVTATNTGTTITQVATFTAAAGGLIEFRSKAEMDAATAVDGTLARVSSSNSLYQRVAGAWRHIYSAWEQYIPSTTNVSGGSIEAAWCRVGDTVHVRIVHSLAGANFTGQPTYSLPVNHHDGSAIEWLDGTCLLRDSSPVAEMLGVIRKSNASTVAPYALAASLTFVQFANVSATSPFTWGAGDTLVMNFSYRCSA